MPKCGDARICQKCSRKIHDFRNKSDFEIGLIHASSEEKVCGIYPSSLDSKPRLATTWFLSASILAFLQLAPQYEAIAKPQTEQLPTTPSDPIKKVASDTTKKNDTKLKFIGTVLDEQNNPVYGAMVHIKGTSLATSTDSSGNFQLDLTDSLAENDSCEIIVHWLGYGKETLTLTADSVKTIGPSDSIVRISPSVKMITYGVPIQEVHVLEKPSFWYRATLPFRRLFSRF